MARVPRFQAGFRLIDGKALNTLIERVEDSGGTGEPLVNTAISTVGAGVLTAAGIVGGTISRTGSTAAYTDTTATAALIIAAMNNPVIGVGWPLTIRNTTAFAQTLAAGTGVTLAGLTTIPANSTGEFLVKYTAAGAVTLTGLSVTDQSFIGRDSIVATADDGTTQTLTAAMITGGRMTYHVTTGGTTPGLTLPLGSAMDTALPAMAIGQSYTLRVVNRNSGTATIITNTGWTLTGTLTLATVTWRDFVITKTAAATYTGVAVGTGTDS